MSLSTIKKASQKLKNTIVSSTAKIKQSPCSVRLQIGKVEKNSNERDLLAMLRPINKAIIKDIFQIMVTSTNTLASVACVCLMQKSTLLQA